MRNLKIVQNCGQDRFGRFVGENRVVWYTDKNWQDKQ